MHLALLGDTTTTFIIHPICRVLPHCGVVDMTLDINGPIAVVRTSVLTPYVAN